MAKKYSRSSRGKKSGKTRQTTNIYVIKAGPYYYVGKSNSPGLRLEAHKTKAKEDEGNNKLKNRIFRKYLHKLSMSILEKPKMSNWRQREIHYIAKYRKKYGREMILNATDGGDGQSGGGHDDSGDSGKKGKKEKDGCSTLMGTLVILFWVFFVLLLCGTIL